jgi:hypothetical protein
LSATGPKLVEPFLNVTDPDGVPPGLVTVAVNVTGEPYGAGLADDESAVEVDALVMVWECVAELAL